MRLKHIKVRKKDVKPFEEGFNNSLNITNLPQGDLHLNEENIPGCNWHMGQLPRGQLSGGNCYRRELSKGEELFSEEGLEWE